MAVDDQQERRANREICHDGRILQEEAGGEQEEVGCAVEGEI